jgi:hypothetical protein
MRVVTFPFGIDSLTLKIEVVEQVISDGEPTRAIIEYGEERLPQGWEWKLSISYTDDIRLVAELAAHEAFHAVDRLGQEWREVIHGEPGAYLVQAIVRECLLEYCSYHVEPIDLALKEI